MQDQKRPWYHGSPFELRVLRSGSVVTPSRELAKAFSHKPPSVSISDDGTIKHNGEVPGFLYAISEDVSPGEILEMPGTDGTHWVIQREMRVELLEEVPVTDPPLLTEEELTELHSQLPEGFTGFAQRNGELTPDS